MQDERKKNNLSHQDVLSHINSNLQDEIMVRIIGRIIKGNKFLRKLCDERLQSEIIFMLEFKYYNTDDHIFEEGDTQDKFVNDIELEEGMFVMQHNKKDNKKNIGIFFLIHGEIIVVQKSTQTFITDLQNKSVFGQISFITGQPRSVTVKSRGFTELMYLDKFRFLKCIDDKHQQASETYGEMYGELLSNPGDYTALNIKCYHCKCKGHIAIDCEFFD